MKFIPSRNIERPLFSSWLDAAAGWVLAYCGSPLLGIDAFASAQRGDMNAVGAANSPFPLAYGIHTSLRQSQPAGGGSPSLAISKGLASLNPRNRFLSPAGREGASLDGMANSSAGDWRKRCSEFPLSPAGRESNFNILAGAQRKLSVRNCK